MGRLPWQHGLKKCPLEDTFDVVTISKSSRRGAYRRTYTRISKSFTSPHIRRTLDGLSKDVEQYTSFFVRSANTLLTVN